MIKFILMDVEGTTTDIRFVKDRLFPYAFEKMDEFIEKNFTTLSKSKEEIGAQSPGEMIETLKGWISEDKKEPVLKAIQGDIWKEGYANGELKGHIYPEVKKCLENWKSNGIDLGIYSSGSVAAQKLLYANSTAGDLTPLLSRHFDLAVGKKFEKQSYEKIVSELGINPENILFLSDIEAELDAAKAVGLKTARLFRDEKEDTKHPSVESFDQIDLSTY